MKITPAILDKNYIGVSTVPKDGFSGMYIEMKSTDPKAKLSAAQEDKIHLLRQHGYQVCVCKGADHAIAVTKDYLGI